MPLLSDYIGISLGIVDSAQVILDKLKTVDGAGSGLDADLFSGDSIGTTTVTATNITATNFIGNGSQLTGIVDSDVVNSAALSFAIALG